MFPDTIHGVRDPQEMLQEPEGDVLVDGVVISQNQCNLQHVLAIEGHPCRTVGLIQMTARRERGAAIEDSNIVQPEEAPSEDALTLGIFSIDPPVEIQHQTLKRLFEET